MHVLNLNSALDYSLDEKIMDSRNSEAFSLPLKLGPLAIWVGHVLFVTTLIVMFPYELYK